MKKYVYLLTVASLLFLSSCLTSKKVVYVKDMVPENLYPVTPPHDVKIQAKDRLSISVSAKNPELAAPFNMGLGSYEVNAQGKLSTGPAIGSTVQTTNYQVDNDGNILFPVLGSLHAEGLTEHELGDRIRNELIGRKLIDNPIVTVELTNMTITMMGEVASIGVLHLQDDRLNLLEAIAMSGGLTNNARPDKVAVIREENGTRKMMLTDVQSVALFHSPAYHLQQNDIVYVFPLAARTSNQEDRTWRYYSLGTGLIGAILSLFILFKIH